MHLPHGPDAQSRFVTSEGLTLTSNATTCEGVTQLNVVNSKGKTVSTTTLDSGESSGAIQVPTTGTATCRGQHGQRDGRRDAQCDALRKHVDLTRL